MFGKKDDISAIEEDGVRTKEDPGELNRRVDLVVNANSFASAVFPKTGKLILGDVGLEFRADSGVGFIQIPWSSVEEVKVDIVANNYVRAITVSTPDCSPLEFVVSDGKNLVRCLAGHVGRERLVQATHATGEVGDAVRRRVGRLFSRGRGEE